MTTTQAGEEAAIGTDERAALEAERDFLLASLEDLDAELASGDLDPGDYERLRDDYTARAARVERSLRRGLDERPIALPTSPKRRVAVAAAVIAFAAGAAFLLTASMGQRLPGQTVTGNAQSGLPGVIRQLEQQVRDNPTDGAARRSLAGARLQNGDLTGALKDFDAAARLDPTDAESRAYAGWLVFQAGLADEALRRLDAAVAASADYPDTHLFRGIVLLRAKNDPGGAVAALERYLALVPAGPLHDDVRAVLADARAQMAAASSTTTTAATP